MTEGECTYKLGVQYHFFKQSIHSTNHKGKDLYIELPYN